jgi:hypothetical protein
LYKDGCIIQVGELMTLEWGIWKGIWIGFIREKVGEKVGYEQ